MFASDKVPGHVTWAVGTTLVGALARFYSIGEPAEVIFDGILFVEVLSLIPIIEVHFGGFTNSYLKGTYFFDIHPPLAKLLLVILAKVIGYDASYNFKQIGNSLLNAAHQRHYYIWLRSLPALFGTMQIPVAFYTVKALGGSLFASIIAAFCMALENMHIIETRLILTDSFLFFGMSVTFLAMIHLMQKKPLTPEWWKSLVICAFCLAFATSVKWTAFSCIGLVGFSCIYSLLKEGTVVGDRSWEDSIKDAGARGALLLGIPFVVYVVSYYFHFMLLTSTGEGDPFHSSEFLKTIKDSRSWSDPNVVPLSFWGKFFELFERMYGANTGIVGDHAWNSRWWSWPILGKGISYWVKYDIKVDGVTGRRHIYLLGNPAVFYLVLAGLAVYGWYLLKDLLRKPGLVSEQDEESVEHLVTKNPDGSTMSTKITTTITHRETLELRKRERKYLASGSFVVLGYWLNILPYVGVKRICFLYHYSPALYLGTLLVGLTFDVLFPDSSSQLKLKKKAKDSDDEGEGEGEGEGTEQSTAIDNRDKDRWVALGFVLSVVGGIFYYFAPLIYGWWMPDAAHEARKWSPTWV